MPLPDLIQIVPPDLPVEANITVPGSKSITNRALVLAALAPGETVLQGALWSEDTQVMVECLQELGFMVNVEVDPGEVCNRTITVYGKSGSIPRGGTLTSPVGLFVGNAGTAARFLSALVCLGEGVYRIHGVPRMHERPQQPLFAALRQLGYHVDSPNDKLPALIHGGGPRPGSCQVSISESSQFASALLLCAKTGGWDVKVTGENAEESAYVRMTTEMLSHFSVVQGNFQIEPDASSGSYFVAASALLAGGTGFKPGGPSGTGFKPVPQISVARWPSSDWQIDTQFPHVLRKHRAFRGLFGSHTGSTQSIETPIHRSTETPPYPISRSRDLGDSIMTAIVLGPFGTEPVTFTDLGRLRLQECERVQALRTELTKCGARVVEEGDSLTVYPSQLHGVEIETYGDHRMAMCFAILGLRVPGMRLRGPACVKKTFPDFYQKLTAPPPGGLKAVIQDAESGRPLRPEDLFAD